MDGKEAFTPSSETPPGAQQSHTTVKSILALPLYQETCICRLLYRLRLEACPAFTLSMRPHVITETWRGDPTLIVLCPFRAHKLRQLRPCGNVIGQVQQDPLNMWICLPLSICVLHPHVSNLDLELPLEHLWRGSQVHPNVVLPNAPYCECGTQNQPCSNTF